MNAILLNQTTVRYYWVEIGLVGRGNLRGFRRKCGMDSSRASVASDQYSDMLAEFLRTGDEASLYRASQVSQAFIESGMGPEDIVALHSESLDRIMAGQSPRNKVRAMAEAHQFLLEIMIAYGIRFKEYLELRLRQTLRDAEAQLEREQERSRDLDRLQREKGEIIGVIAHELRTPLTAVKGNLDLSSNLLKKGEVLSASQRLTLANEALDRLSRLTADLVEASREGRPALTFALHDLSPIVTQAVAWAEPLAKSKNVSLLRPTPKSSAAVQLDCDPDALLSILGNILSNAVRYTPSGGRVTVSYGANDGWAWIKLQDTGIGMTPEVQKRIFEKFYRAPEARMQEARGLGLGLSLAYQLVQAHNGRLEVESTPGKGSIFRVLIPLASSGKTESSELEE